MGRRWWPIAAALALIAAPGPLRAASPVGPSPIVAQTHRRAVEIASSTLNRLNMQYHLSSDANRNNQLITRMAETARLRRRALETLLDLDPSLAASLTFWPVQRTQFPYPILQEIEQQDSLEGVYGMDRDATPGPSLGAVHHWLTIRDARYELHFLNGAPELAPGERVAVRGLRIGQRVIVDELAH